MKKRYIFIFSMLFAAICGGCQDFLHLVPKNKVIVANVEDVRTELLTYLAGITYSVKLEPSYGSTHFRFPFYNEVAAYLCLYEDDIDMMHFSDHPDGESSIAAYNECIDWKAVGMASNLWVQCYGTIGFMNAILDDLEKVGEYTQPEYETITGEARVIRAYHIFKLLQFFAPYHNDKLGIPLNLDSENMEPGGRWSQTEVYRLLTDELTEVLGYRTNSQSWNIFYQTGIVKALLAQIYWFKAGSAAAEESDWANAEKYSGDLIARYSPEDRSELLADQFSAGYAEYVLNSLYFQVKFAYPKAWTIGDQRTGFWAEGEAQHASEDLLGLYDPQDIRLEAWFKKNMDDNNQEYYGINKPAYKRPISEITVLFRTAEMFLINAEAKCRLERIPEARRMLETFRASRIPDYAGFEGEDVLDEILKERRKELCYELGTRWMDMKRLGIGMKRLGYKKEGQGVETYELQPDDYRFALPIPVEQELSYNNYLEQNPGWGNLNKE